MSDLGAPKVAIVGRPNVGKSTLFNRLFGRKRALVHDLPGVTRDRLEEEAEWWVNKKRYKLKLIDTGGLGGETFAEDIAHQVQLALNEADLVLALFDAQSGYTPADQEVIQRMIRSGLAGRDIPIFGVVNKIDDNKHEELVHEFYESGLAPIFGVSAEHDRGMDDLQKAVVEALEEAGKLDASPETEEEVRDLTPRIAIVGKPNVGKSTFVNAVLGQDRMIVSDVAGTTIDSIDTEVELDGKKLILIDTAGIRRKSKTEQGVEVLSVVQSRKALERCDIAILMIDAEGGSKDQDEKIGGLIEEVGCSVILCVNKWDTQRNKKGVNKDSAVEEIRRNFDYLKYAPILFTSAKEKTGFQDLAELAYDIMEQRRLKIQTREFTEWVREESEIHNPYNVKFYMSHQSGRHPPTFVCHVSDPKKVHFSLSRHLVNAMREKWGYMGSPIRLLFVQGKSRTGPGRKNDPADGPRLLPSKKNRSRHAEK